MGRRRVTYKRFMTIGFNRHGNGPAQTAPSTAPHCGGLGFKRTGRLIIPAGQARLTGQLTTAWHH
jgi:hypothetical protein